MKYFTLFVLSVFSFVFSFIFSGQSYAMQMPETEAKQAIVIDAETGTVLFEKNADERMPTSSMSKVMTTIIAYDAIRDGKITMDTEFPVSERAWKMGGSRMFVDLNSNVKVSDLIQGVVVQSGNDACVVLAEGIAGSEENFVGMINKKADEIGMKDSHFMNSNGWPDPDHYSTARDLAKMGLYLIKNYPEDYKFYSEKEFVYNNIKQGNRNPLLYDNLGADGIKTGHTEDGGYGLIGTAVSGERRVMLVINGTSSMQARADESRKLLKWAQLSFKNINAVQKGKVVASAPVILGDTRSVELVPSDNLRLTVPSVGHDMPQVEAQYSVPVTAPVKAGDELGKLVVTLNDGSTKEVPLVANHDVAEAPFFKRIGEKFMLMIVGAPKY